MFVGDRTMASTLLAGAAAVYRTILVSWHQRNKTNLDFTKARVSEWQWHEVGHM